VLPLPDPVAQPAAGWANWVVFAGVMLVVLGCFHAIEGLVALFQDKYYVVRPGGLVGGVGCGISAAGCALGTPTLGCAERRPRRGRADPRGDAVAVVS